MVAVFLDCSILFWVDTVPIVSPCHGRINCKLPPTNLLHASCLLKIFSAFHGLSSVSGNRLLFFQTPEHLFPSHMPFSTLIFFVGVKKKICLFF